jgi:hypothetical protein
MVPNPWGREKKRVTILILQKQILFDFLLERGQIKLPTNHVMLPPE